MGLTDVLCRTMSASEVTKFMLLLCVSYEYLSKEEIVPVPVLGEKLVCRRMT
jgi:hypothetical protein